MTNSRLSLFLAGAAALALAASGCDRAANATTQAPKATPAPIIVRAETALARNVPELLEATGTLVPHESAAVAAERDGRVVEIPIERGSFVAAGAPMAVLENREARASVSDAEASLAWTEAEVERYSGLRDKGVISKADLQRKNLDLQSAKARLDLAKKALEDTIIRAPFSGLVAERRISTGAFVRRGEAIATLVQVDPIRAELAIPESAATAVKKGQKIALSVQSFPGREFEGEIAYVGPSLKSEARTLVVEALVPNPGRLLQPGLFARARIEMPRSAPAVFVPKTAVVTEAGVSRIFVLGPSAVSERIVSVGEARGAEIEVRSGVKAGERVVVSPDHRMADGLTVSR